MASSVIWASPQSVRTCNSGQPLCNILFLSWKDVKVIGFTSMMDHNHGPHPRHAVKRVDAPQSVGVDAASGVAKDSGFCGPIGSVSHLASSY